MVPVAVGVVEDFKGVGVVHAFARAWVVGNESLRIVAANHQHVVNWPGRAEVGVAQKPPVGWN